MTSIWSHKPWWCQPWSILLAGSAAISISWFVIHAIWFTALVGVGVMLWWLLFLVVVPKAYLDSLSDSADDSQ